MQAGFFEKQIVLTPDLCGSAATLSPLAAFTIFQGVASEHAEKIGVGGAARVVTAGTDGCDTPSSELTVRTAARISRRRSSPVKRFAALSDAGTASTTEVSAVLLLMFCRLSSSFA